MALPGKSFTDPDNNYRYGFQNQETDKELWDGAVSYKYRIEDPRLGRFFSVDPLSAKYPYYSAYQFSGNRVIDMIELEGLEPSNPPLYNGQREIAIDQESEKCEYYNYYGSGHDWMKGSCLSFVDGAAYENNNHFDLDCNYYDGVEINCWQNCSDQINIGENCHWETLYSMFYNGIRWSDDAAQKEALSLLYHFYNGAEGQTSSPLYFNENSEIAKIMRSDEAVENFVNMFSEYANDYLSKRGNLEGFNGNYYLKSLRRSPSCNYIDDTWYMNTIMGGFCQMDVSIVGINNGKVVLSIVYYDHFGAGTDDASKIIPGLPSMYYLQHNLSLIHI